MWCKGRGSLRLLTNTHVILGRNGRGSVSNLIQETEWTPQQVRGDTEYEFVTPHLLRGPETIGIEKSKWVQTGFR
jgi:hypothetical protein